MSEDNATVPHGPKTPACTSISDNGPQFVAKDLKTFIRIAGVKHVRTLAVLPAVGRQDRGWNKLVKNEAIRPTTPRTLEEARALASEYVDHYNHVRLHSAIG